MDQAIDQLELDLRGMTVLTEAASGNYVITPILAAKAGSAHVHAITADSEYGTARDVADATYHLAELCGVRDRIEVVQEKSERVLSSVDIATNLGFVRPIDRNTVAMLSPQAVIPYMCEAWEVRPNDVDLAACSERGIPVMATDEGHPDVDVFRFSGSLCIKMLHALDIEVYGCKIAVVSTDRFGTTIEEYVTKAGASVGLFPSAGSDDFRAFISTADALVLADYQCGRTILGRGGDMEPEDLAQTNPSIAVVQFGSGASVTELSRVGIPCFPAKQVSPHRMGLTLADLGPNPVVLLHAAGLKVGTAMKHARKIGLEGDEFTQYVLAHSPAQMLTA